VRSCRDFESAPRSAFTFRIPLILLALCGGNLVYRCDLVEGIEREHVAPFRYIGVPDEVDYADIPWRSSRFKAQALSGAVSTQKRALI